jgi:hypothetical protein
MTENNKKERKNSDDDEEEEEEDDDTCPMDECENKRNLNNKKGRCNSCQKWWYEVKRVFFGRERRCVKCQEIFEPETLEKDVYFCVDCIEI